MVGSSGTIVEIVNGNVIFDFRDFCRRNGPLNDLHRACISEVSLIFKLELPRIQQKIRENKGRQVSASNMSLKYFNELSDKLLYLPLLVVEDETHVEVRDCYLRSMRKDQKLEGQSPKELRLEMEEFGFYINGSKVSEEHFQNRFQGSLYLKSCIFYNFFDSIRSGVNASVNIVKCHLSECRNNSIYAVNPRVLKVANSTLSKPLANCISVDMLQQSDDTDFVR